MFGALRSPEDPDDRIFERLAKGPAGFYMAEMPTEYDLRKFGQRARDQGLRGTCAAHTAAVIKEIQENRDCGFNERMSPEFIYYHRDNKPGNGMYGRNVFQILQKIGSVPENMYQYQSDENAPPPDEHMYRIARKYRISNYARVTTIDGLKRAILELGPCFLLLPLYANRPEFWRARSDADSHDGGHAVAVVGFNATGFILQNSWGPQWNGDGCITFPYTDWGAMWECWTSVDEKTDLADLSATLVPIGTPHAQPSTVSKKSKSECLPRCLSKWF